MSCVEHIATAQEWWLWWGRQWWSHPKCVVRYKPFKVSFRVTLIPFDQQLPLWEASKEIIRYACQDLYVIIFNKIN